MLIKQLPLQELITKIAADNAKSRLVARVFFANNLKSYYSLIDALTDKADIVIRISDGTFCKGEDTVPDIKALIDYLDVPSKADKRDITAIKRLCTAFVKLLYPNALHKEDIAPDEFVKYCLNPAKEMRAIIKRQLCIVDPKEFDILGKNTIPDVQYKKG